MVPEDTMQACKGQSQPTVLPNYYAYDPLNHQHCTIPLSVLQWYEYTTGKSQFSN